MILHLTWVWGYLHFGGYTGNFILCTEVGFFPSILHVCVCVCVCECECVSLRHMYWSSCIVYGDDFGFDHTHAHKFLQDQFAVFCSFFSFCGFLLLVVLLLLFVCFAYMVLILVFLTAKLL